MALPVTFSDTVALQPGARPRKVGSSFYIVLQDASTLTDIKVLKADGDDPTDAWTEQDSGNRPSGVGDVKVIADTVDGTLIHIATDDDNSEVDYHTFDTSDDTWGITNEQVVSDSDSGTARTSIGISIRSDGDVLITYQGAPENISSTDYGRSYVARRESSSWTVDIRVDDQGSVTHNFIEPHAIMADQTNDRFHIYYDSHFQNDLLYSTYLADNTFGHQHTVIEGSVATSNRHFCYDAVAFTDTQRKIRISFRDNNNDISIAGFDDADSPSASLVQVDLSGNRNPFAATLAVDDKTQHCLFTTSSTIYHSQTGDGDDTWGTVTEERASGDGGEVVSSNVYDGVLAYLYLDGGVEKYNERVLADPAQQIAATSFALSPTFIPPAMVGY